MSSDIILHPAEPTLDGKLLDDLLDLYLRSCNVEPDTLTGYTKSLGYIRKWWALYGPRHRHTLCPSALELCARHLQDIKLSLNTRKAIHTRLRQCFRWAYKTGRISIDCAQWVPTPRGYTPAREIAADVGTFRKLYLASEQTVFPERTKAVLAVLIGTGMRCSECASLRVSSIHFAIDLSGTIQIVEAKRVRGRAIDQRLVGFDSATGTVLKDWLLFLSDTSEWLFPSETKPTNHLTRRTICRVVKEAAVKAKVNRVIKSPHDIRRAYVTWISRQYKGEGHSDLLRRQLGHSTYSMTAEYSFLNADDIRQTFKSPIAYL